MLAAGRDVAVAPPGSLWNEVENKPEKLTRLLVAIANR